MNAMSGCRLKLIGAWRGLVNILDFSILLGDQGLHTLVGPQWWSFADVCQQGLDFSKKISKRKLFDFHISDMDFQFLAISVAQGSNEKNGPNKSNF